MPPERTKLRSPPIPSPPSPYAFCQQQDGMSSMNVAPMQRNIGEQNSMADQMGMKLARRMAYQNMNHQPRQIVPPQPSPLSQSYYGEYPGGRVNVQQDSRNGYSGRLAYGAYAPNNIGYGGEVSQPQPYLYSQQAPANHLYDESNNLYFQNNEFKGGSVNMMVATPRYISSAQPSSSSTPPSFDDQHIVVNTTHETGAVQNAYVFYPVQGPPPQELPSIGLRAVNPPHQSPPELAPAQVAVQEAFDPTQVRPSEYVHQPGPIVEANPQYPRECWYAHPDARGCCQVVPCCMEVSPDKQVMEAHAQEHVNNIYGHIAGKQKVACPWNKCVTELRRDGLKKHIVNVHYRRSREFLQSKSDESNASAGSSPAISAP